MYNCPESAEKYKTLIRTEGIKYAGSKLKIIPQIIAVIQDLKDVKTVLDGFSGTTRVSQAFAQSGYQTSSNDISCWSEVFANCYLISEKSDTYYQEIIDHLNGLSGTEGWFTHQFSILSPDKKKPFQPHNLMKLDAVRQEIHKLNLNFIDESVLLTSLILALDKVDNTMGHFASYLSEWSPRSYREMKLQLPTRFQHTGQNKVFRKDVFETIENNEFDFVYFDPPYGSNNGKMPASRVRYASYYHLWTTIILNDQPELFGKVNRRTDSRDTHAISVFEEFRKNENGQFIAMDALARLIKKTKAHYILLSYSSGGRATREELHDIIHASGKLLKAIEIDYRRNVMSSMRWTNEWINSDGKYLEYLFLMEKF